MNQWEVTITAIFAVLGCSALLGWMAWRFLKSSENPRIVRRRLLPAAVIYGFGAFFGIKQFVTGEAPLWSLAFLPISLGAIWMYVHAAREIQIPPNG
jgi:hypothetical protein